MAGSSISKRLTQEPHREMMEIINAPRIKEELGASFGYLARANQAHVVMLARGKIISRGAARQLLTAIQGIVDDGPGSVPVDPEREDLYYNYEHAIIQRTSDRVGGQLHTGRSRNDLGAALMRMRTREILTGLINELLKLRALLLEKSREHALTVMPGYTHNQPAQPITLGHYLSAIEAGLARDTARLMGALRHTGSSPLGACALAGTSYPIDRDLLARLLGFPETLTNTIDAVAGRDYLLEALAQGTILGLTLSRFMQDLTFWSAHESGLIEFPDSIAGTSSIMPQKKNLILIEHIKGRVAQVGGAFTTACLAVRNTSYSNTIDANREGFVQAWGALNELRSSLRLCGVVVENLIANKSVMLERCQQNFSTVTQLADALVEWWGISFREAHLVVGRVVSQAVARGVDATGIEPDMLKEAAQALLGIKVDADQEMIRRHLDPCTNVKVREVSGGPGPRALEDMVGAACERLARDRSELNGIEQVVENASKELEREVQAILDACQ